MVSHTGALHLILNSLAFPPLLGLPIQLINTSIMMSLMPVNAIPLFLFLAMLTLIGLLTYGTDDQSLALFSNLLVQPFLGNAVCSQLFR